jgi:hypothetical protein
MEMIEISGFLPDTAKNVKHRSARDMEQVVRGMAESNGGKVQSFEVTKPGTALLFVFGDQSMQFIMKEFKLLQNVTVSLVPALGVHLAKNKKVQEKADHMRAVRKKTA